MVTITSNETVHVCFHLARVAYYVILTYVMAIRQSRVPTKAAMDRRSSCGHAGVCMANAVFGSVGRRTADSGPSATPDEATTEDSSGARATRLHRSSPQTNKRQILSIENMTQ